MMIQSTGVWRIWFTIQLRLQRLEQLNTLPKSVFLKYWGMLRDWDATRWKGRKQITVVMTAVSYGRLISLHWRRNGSQQKNYALKTTPELNQSSKPWPRSSFLEHAGTITEQKGKSIKFKFPFFPFLCCSSLTFPSARKKLLRHKGSMVLFIHNYLVRT